MLFQQKETEYAAKSEMAQLLSFVSNTKGRLCIHVC